MNLNFIQKYGFGSSEKVRIFILFMFKRHGSDSRIQIRIQLIGKKVHTDSVIEKEYRYGYLSYSCLKDTDPVQRHRYGSNPLKRYLHSWFKDTDPLLHLSNTDPALSSSNMGMDPFFRAYLIRIRFYSDFINLIL